jgi:hypothetical protein
MLRKTPDAKLEEVIAKGIRIQHAFRAGVRRALMRHKRLGESIAVWRDGQVVIVPPDQINIPDAESPNGSGD